MTSESMGRTARTVNAEAAPLVDPEFKALLPPLTRDQRAGLERDILENPFGISSPLTVWAEEGILLDGHNRLEIAQRRGLPFQTQERSFPTREAAVEWIFANQRDRRNLTPKQLDLVMGRHYNRTKKDIGGPRKASPEKQDLRAEKTSYRLAKAYGVGHDTIEKNGKFAAAVDTLRTVDPDIEARVITGKGLTKKTVLAAAAKADSDPTEALAILAAAVKPEPKETLADKRGFRNLPNRALADRVAASLLALETHVEFLETVNPERLNGERESLTERLCKAARLLNRTRIAWVGEKK